MAAPLHGHASAIGEGGANLPIAKETYRAWPPSLGCHRRLGMALVRFCQEVGLDRETDFYRIANTDLVAPLHDASQAMTHKKAPTISMSAMKLNCRSRCVMVAHTSR